MALFYLLCCSRSDAINQHVHGIRHNGCFIKNAGSKAVQGITKSVRASARENGNGRLSDYESKLDDFYVNSRILFLNGELDDGVAYRLISSILRMKEADPNAAIKFYINSPGGSVSSGMAIYDILQSLNMPVETICLGQAASMGAFLLAAGTKGMRFAMPNSRIMIHQPLGGAHGQVSDIEIQANEILRIRQILNAHLSHFTGQPVEKIEKDCDRDYYMPPAEAIEYGLIDRICKTKTSDIPIAPIPPIS
ncbi:hypothetical protein BgAZ_303400 [Babesia gibsoni]|uniref:ATP-dependent Clp protease proteolytic subunit n=1 Tax=Babesia gibsoni TaxID=33632 RepID=A0AAD8LJR8_BABGI|nr:hypothetical protein BgAZ_303400 [Babesia gibsoni]